MITNPFPGLRAFETDEDHLYFGRDDQSDEILKRLRCNRFVAVVGASGSGKSSLIKAGLLPSLHGGFMVKAGSRWRIAVFRPGDRPIHNLAFALSAHGVLSNGSKVPGADALTVETTLRRSALGLIEAVRQARLPAQENLLIVVDQFEELFRFKAGLETEAFVKLLIEASRWEDLPIYVVITMRSDFLGQCARFRELPEVINEGLYLIPLMTRAQYREAIDGPAAVAGANVSPSLVNRLLNDIGDKPEELPIMQHALMRTWAHWLDSHGEGAPLDLSQYEDVGGMAEALSRHADEAYNELSEKHQQLAEKIFRTLTEKRPGNPGVRRPTRVAELCAITEAEEADVIAVVESFRRAGRSFLMPPPQVPLDSQTLIDISHESLISGWNRLRGWVDGEALSVAIYRRVADTAELYYKEEREAALWRDPDLKLALGWQEKARPNKAWGEHYHSGFEAAINFLKESKQAVEDRLVERDKQRKQALRRTQVTATALFVLALATTAFGVVAWKKSGYAETQATNAEIARGQAETAKDRAEKAERGALKAQADAVEAKEDAVREWMRAETKAAEAQTNLALANVEKRNAQHARRVAEEQKDTAEVLALRMRQQNVQDGNMMLYMTDLLEKDSPSLQQNAHFHSLRSMARSRLLDHQEAIKDASLALETIPDHPPTLGHRGYEYLLFGKPQLAVQDFERYLKDNPTDSNQYLNLSIGLGMLGKHAEAIDAANKAIKNFTYIGGEYFDSVVSPEIQKVTAQRILFANGDAFKTALKYQPATLLAFSGGNRDSFADVLHKADEEARTNPRPLDAYLVALNWVWLQQEQRPADKDGVPDEYGVFVIQGALWERASASKPGLAKQARKYYTKFLEEHRKRRDPKYNELAKWLAMEMHRRDKRRFPIQRGNLEALKLTIEAEESMARREKTWRIYMDRALALEPENVDLRLKSLRLRLSDTNGNNFDGTVEDCQKILERDPNSTVAHLIVSLAKGDIDRTEFTRKLVETDPSDRDTLTNLVELLSKAGRKEEALKYLRRGIRTAGGNPDLLYRKAELLAEKGGAQDLVEAEKSIETAIRLKPDEPQFYDVQEKIKGKKKEITRSASAERQIAPGHADGETGGTKSDESGVDSNLVRQRAAGYNTAADAMLKRGELKKAHDTYVQSLRFLVGIPKDQRSVDVQWDMTVTLRKLGKLIERQESKAKAIEAMEQMKREFGDSEDVRELLDDEIKRLSTSP